MPQYIEQLDPNFATTLPGDDLAWYDVRALGVEGVGWAGEADFPFGRLPARAKNIVKPAVWELSRHSAGICVRFVTAAASIAAAWKLIAPGGGMPHMPATGVSGLDVYVRHEGAWRWIGLGRPTLASDSAQATVVKELSSSGLPPQGREFALYFPLYNGVADVKIGIPRDARIAKAPPRAGGDRPIVFYGTSIVQGGCASRAGLAYPAILGRWLDCSTINLGFSGNGPMDLEMAPLLGELDAAACVLDCGPNMLDEVVATRTVPFIKTLREARPRTHIVLVETIIFQNTFDEPDSAHRVRNKLFRAAYQSLVDSGMKGLHYVPADELLGHDWEATVDGVHPNDIGFLRFAQALLPVLKPLVG